MEDFRSNVGSRVRPTKEEEDYRAAVQQVNSDDVPDFKIQCLDPSSVPSDGTIVITGKRHTGKSVLLRDIMYRLRNKVDLVIGICPTELGSGTLNGIAPKMFTYTRFDLGILQRLIDTQTAVRESGETPLKIMLILDDCMSDASLLKKTQVREIFMNGRHLNIGIIMTAQYMMDLPNSIRTNIDFIFSFREPSVGNRERLYRNFFGVFSRPHDFEIVFRVCTEGYRCIALDNRTKTMNPERCVFYYQAQMRQGSFRTGKARFWRMSHALQYDSPKGVHTIDDLARAPMVGGAQGAKGKKKAKVTLGDPKR